MHLWIKGLGEVGRGVGMEGGEGVMEGGREGGEDINTRKWGW